jgi:molybdate-binding protein
MGVQAAATEFGLDFRRLGEETYFLVFDEQNHHADVVDRIRQSLMTFVDYDSPTTR